MCMCKRKRLGNLLALWGTSQIQQHFQATDKLSRKLYRLKKRLINQVFILKIEVSKKLRKGY